MCGKLSILLSVATVLLASGAFALELIELNDANQSILNLALSKALKSVQNAYNGEFRFHQVGEAIKFVDSCEYAHSVIDSAKDDDFQGLAAKIKAILADETVQRACSVKTSDLSEFLALDEEPGEYSYLSTKKLKELIAFKQLLSEKPDVEFLIGHVFEHAVDHCTKKLLNGAAEDVAVFFDEPKPKGAFDFHNQLRSGCEIRAIKPICKLVRRSNDETVSAIGRDFAEFKTLMASNDAEKLDAYSKASGVELDELKETCAKIKKNLNPMARVDGYKEANFIAEETIVDQAKADRNFDLFYNLYQLCLVSVN